MSVSISGNHEGWALCGAGVRKSCQFDILLYRKLCKLEEVRMDREHYVANGWGKVGVAGALWRVWGGWATLS